MAQITNILLLLSAAMLLIGCLVLPFVWVGMWLWEADTLMTYNVLRAAVTSWIILIPVCIVKNVAED